MSTIFAKIITGEIPCHKIAEDDNYLAFLDINPLVMGHTLVIPKVEEPYIFNLSDEQLSGLILFAKKIAPAIEKAVTCKRIGIAVIGLEVPHTHIHLVPLNHVGDINFEKPKMNPSMDMLQQMCNNIKQHI
jgi:histidine triad (HIT) family protein